MLFKLALTCSACEAIVYKQKYQVQPNIADWVQLHLTEIAQMHKCPASQLKKTVVEKTVKGQDAQAPRRKASKPATYRPKR